LTRTQSHGHKQDGRCVQEERDNDTFEITEFEEGVEVLEKRLWLIVLELLGLEFRSVLTRQCSMT
jgi:hypothetical protein